MIKYGRCASVRLDSGLHEQLRQEVLRRDSRRCQSYGRSSLEVVTTGRTVVFAIVLADLIISTSNSDQVLNRHTKLGKAERRSCLRSFLVKTDPGTLSGAVEAKLRATIVIEILFGEQYPICVLLDNNQGIIEPPASN
jgi:hypothetical protein